MSATRVLGSAERPVAMDLSQSPDFAPTWAVERKETILTTEDDYDLVTEQDAYTFVKKLGQGAFGTVYEAENKEQALVAIKETETNSMNLHELDTLRAVRSAGGHPHVLNLFDAGFKRDRLYIVTTLHEATVLDAMLAPTPPHPRTRERWVAEVAAGMSFLLDLGLYQTDLKPNNVLLTLRDNPAEGKTMFKSEGERAWSLYSAVVADFGLVLYAPRGWLYGRPSFPAPYWPPELLGLGAREAVKMDGLTLSWVIGVFAYHVLTGATPFPSDQPSVLRQLQGAYFKDPAVLLSRIPADGDFRETVKQLLQLGPRDRASFVALARAVGVPVEPGVPIWTPGPRKVDQKGLAIGLACLVDIRNVSVMYKYLAVDFYYRYADLIDVITAEDMTELPFRGRAKIENKEVLEVVVYSEGPVFYRPNFFSQSRSDEELLRRTREAIRDPDVWNSTDPDPDGAEPTAGAATAILDGQVRTASLFAT